LEVFSNLDDSLILLFYAILSKVKKVSCSNTSSISDTIMMIVFTLFSTFTSQKHKNNNKKGCLGNKSKSLRERKTFSKYSVQKVMVVIFCDTNFKSSALYSRLFEGKKSS